MRWTALLLPLLGCPKASTAPVAAPVAEATDVPRAEANPELAPFPYTQGQIRDSWTLGLVVRWSITVGGETGYQRWEVVGHDEESATLSYVETDADGAPLVGAEQDVTTWEELQRHASFPAEVTTVDKVDYQAPWGAEPATLYVVEAGEEGVRRFWFGDRTPGAPLRHTVEKGGVVVMDMTMLSRGVPK